MGFTQKLVQRVPTIFFLLGLAAFGFGRKASRTNVESQIPGWVGYLLLGIGLVLWVVINFVVGVDAE